ncbi:MAG: sulfotransferase, partial [Paracoccaceae bacterium]|nr:sulfotransferase [Paracoccaceae bacterium]
MGKLQVLMISGSGRSGTTILSLLLSQGANTLNLGQSRDFWRSYAEAQPCTCGVPMPACPLWSKVVEAAFPDWQVADFRDMDHRMRAFMLDAGGVRDWSESAALEHLRQAHAPYLADLHRFLAAAQTVTGATQMVDSSKAPETALALWMTGAETYVLNVVRDPRAVAVSWARKTGKSRIQKYMTAWRDRQHRLATWPEAPGLHHRQLSYEGFADAPEATLASVATWAGHANPVP